MAVKDCPFNLPAPPGQRDCIGTACINFEWRLGGPMENNQYTLLLGSCSYFDRWTGHQQPNLANMPAVSDG